jgi:large subunit ribosomal protein L18
MSSLDIKKQTRLKRKKRVRKKIFGTPQRPRLTVFRSSRHIYAQIVDDTAGHTLVAASTTEKALPASTGVKGKIAVATAIGKIVAQRAKEKGIAQVVFDRNGFLYHGRVKAVSDGAREAGLDF